MEVRVKSIQFTSGTIAHGKNQGKEYKGFVITLGHASLCACGNGLRGFTYPIWNSDRNSREIYQFLDTVKRTPVEEQKGTEDLDMADFKSKCVDDYKDLLYWMTNLYDHKTGVPELGCLRFGEASMRLDGKPNDDPSTPSKWIRLDKDGKPATRWNNGRNEVITATHHLVHWLEQFTMDYENGQPKPVWIKLGGGEITALNDDRDRLYEPVDAEVHVNNVDVDNDENPDTGSTDGTESAPEV